MNAQEQPTQLNPSETTRLIDLQRKAVIAAMLEKIQEMPKEHFLYRTQAS